MKKDVDAYTDEWVTGSSTEWVPVGRKMNMDGRRKKMKIHILPYAMEIQRH